MEPITINAIIHADLETTWEFYVNPEHIIHWNFASEDWHCPKAINNLKIGEKFVYSMAAKNGEMSFDFSGLYTEIIPFQRISYTIEDGRRVNIILEAQENNTLFTITFEAENIHPRELQQQGWQSILDNFKKYTESFI